MIRRRDTYPDLLDVDASQARHRVISALDRIYGRGTLPPATDDAIRRAIRTPTASQSRSGCMRFRHPLSVLLSIPLIVLVMLGLGHSITPARVSAEVILQRAAAVGLPPDRALHLVYRRWVGTNTGRLVVWEQADPHGTIIRTAGTITERSDGMTVWTARYVTKNGATHFYSYEPTSKHKTIHIASDPAMSTQAGPFVGIFASGRDVARYIAMLKHRSQARIRLLPERRFHGALVYPIRVDIHGSSHLPNFTAYIDAQTYILRAIDGSMSSGPNGNAVMESQLLITYEAAHLSDVPPGTFELEAPGGTRVSP